MAAKKSPVKISNPCNTSLIFLVLAAFVLGVLIGTKGVGKLTRVFAPTITKQTDSKQAQKINEAQESAKYFESDILPGIGGLKDQLNNNKAVAAFPFNINGKEESSWVIETADSQNLDKTLSSSIVSGRYLITKGSWKQLDKTVDCFAQSVSLAGNSVVVAESCSRYGSTSAVSLYKIASGERIKIVDSGKRLLRVGGFRIEADGSLNGKLVSGFFGKRGQLIQVQTQWENSKDFVIVNAETGNITDAYSFSKN